MSANGCKEEIRTLFSSLISNKNDLDEFMDAAEIDYLGSINAYKDQISPPSALLDHLSSTHSTQSTNGSQSMNDSQWTNESQLMNESQSANESLSMNHSTGENQSPNSSQQKEVKPHVHLIYDDFVGLELSSKKSWADNYKAFRTKLEEIMIRKDIKNFVSHKTELSIVLCKLITEYPYFKLPDDVTGFVCTYLLLFF